MLTGSQFCRGTFDGWLCWPDTDAGVTVHQPCPQFISGFDPTSEFVYCLYIFSCMLEKNIYVRQTLR